MKKLITPLATVLFSLALLAGLHTTASAANPSALVVTGHQGRGETVLDFGTLCPVTQARQFCIYPSMTIENDMLEQSVLAQISIYDNTAQQWVPAGRVSSVFSVLDSGRKISFQYRDAPPLIFTPGWYYIRTEYYWQRSDGWRRYVADNGWILIF